jgi:hypothetical protein
MSRFRPRRPSPAMVVALFALFVAMGGVGYASLKLPKNSVGPKQLDANAVTSPKVKDGSLLAGDFRAGQLPAGPQGPQGLQGLRGDKGDTGSVGPTEGVASDNPTANGIALDPSLTVDPVTLTTTRAGRLFVGKPITSFSLNCSGGGTGKVWAMLDGVRVPGTAYSVASGTQYTLSFTGVTKDVIPPGAHVLAAGLRCDGSASIAAAGDTAQNAGTLVVLGG